MNGIIFIVNGISGTEDGCSVLSFQDTFSYLSNLTILGNSKMQSTAICFWDSSQITINFMIIRGVTIVNGGAIHAVDSTVEFIGHNIFDSNTANNNGGTGVLHNSTINVMVPFYS